MGPRRDPSAARPSRLERLARVLATGGALIGGAVWLALVAMTLVSVTGRAAIDYGLGPVPGDFEFVEMGTAFAVIACLPYASWRRAHARVELVIGDRRAAAPWLDRVADATMFLVAVVLGWQLARGLAEKYAWGETTFILQWPVWWAYAACLAATVLWAAVALLCVFVGDRVAR